MFDPCDHKVRQIVIKAGREIRKAKGLPEEKDITVLFNETAPLLGIAVQILRSTDASKMPAPHEMKQPDGRPIIPQRACIQCGNQTMALFPLCSSCSDAEGGKYRTMWKCTHPGCEHKEKSEKFFAKWLDELGIDFKSGTKQSLGIKTVTDEGLK